MENFLIIFKKNSYLLLSFLPNLRETPWLRGHHAAQSVTLFFIITMLLTGHHAMPVVI